MTAGTARRSSSSAAPIAAFLTQLPRLLIVLMNFPMQLADQLSPQSSDPLDQRRAHRQQPGGEEDRDERVPSVPRVDMFAIDAQFTPSRPRLPVAVLANISVVSGVTLESGASIAKGNGFSSCKLGAPELAMPTSRASARSLC